MRDDLPFQVIAREWMDSAIVVPAGVAVFIFGLSLWLGIRRQTGIVWYADPWVKNALVLLTLMLGTMFHNDWVWLLLWGVHYAPGVMRWLENFWWTAAVGQGLVLAAMLCVVRIWTPMDWRLAEWYKSWWRRPWVLAAAGSLLFTFGVHWKDWT